MQRREFLKFTTLAGIIASYPSIAVASGNGDNFILGGEVHDASKAILGEIFKTNDFYAKSKGPGFFETFKASQHPRVTVVGCSDSRFQVSALDTTPENDLFVIRNIGNQYTTNEGSVQYGVHHLHTPLLMIVGHSRCGAIKAALSDYSEESSGIRREVDALAISIKKSRLYGTEEQKWLQGVMSNVKMQVTYAKREFEEEVKSGKLTIVGVVFDLANDIGEGHGKLKVVSINGESDSEEIKNHALLRSIVK